MKTLLILPALLVLLATGCDTAERAQAAEPAVVATNDVPVAAVATPKADSTNAPAVSAADTGTLPKPPPELPAPVQDVVQLAQNTLGEQVLVDFVATIETPYSLTVDHVIYLKDLGIAENVIAALLKRQVALGGAPVELPDEDALVEASATNAPAGPKLALTNAPGANVGLATAPAPVLQPTPNAPTQGESAGAAPAPAPEPAAPVNYNVFYNSLSPYGTWVEVGDYGWCWQPTVTTVNVGWRPYCDNGRWVWSSSGWYWHSYYSWGWAPFHYGRWCNVPARGWCWVPGTTWGPSWVSWRHCDDHFGWAPLPPACGWATGIGLTYHGAGVSVGFSFGLGAGDYCFVPRHRFYDPHCYRFRAPRHELTGLYHRSSVVNNYVVGNNNTVIINNGVGRDIIQKHTRDEIRPVALADARQPGRSSAIAARPGNRSERLEVYRPTLAANASASRPPATVLARQEARPQPIVSRSGGNSAGGGFIANRPVSSQPDRNEGTGAGNGRQEVRSERPGLSNARNPGVANRPTVLPRREVQSPALPINNRTAARTEPRPALQSGADNPAAVQLHGRSEGRPSVVVPRSDLTGGRNVRPSVGTRSEIRPAVGEPHAEVGQTTVQPAPSVSSPAVDRPVFGRSESRPLPQQQLQVRRDTPAYVQPQPSAPVSRPDLASRFTPAPGPSPQPRFTPPQPAAQPRFEARPQVQQQAPRVAPQPAAPARSYSPPVSSRQGSGSDRSGASRPSPSRNQQP